MTAKRELRKNNTPGANERLGLFYWMQGRRMDAVYHLYVFVFFMYVVYLIPYAHNAHIHIVYKHSFLTVLASTDVILQTVC